VDHRVEAAERIDLRGDVLGAGDGLEVALTIASAWGSARLASSARAALRACRTT
jgi:hypothetical protein